jgi:hypothetical protein
MKKGLVITATLLAVLTAGILFLYAEEKAPPKELTFEAKNGNVTFNHENRKRLRSDTRKGCTRRPKKERPPAAPAITPVGRPSRRRGTARSATSRSDGTRAPRLTIRPAGRP